MMRNEFTRTASAEEIVILFTPKFKDLLLLSKSVKLFDHTGLSFHLIFSPRKINPKHKNDKGRLALKKNVNSGLKIRVKLMFLIL